MSGEDAPRPYLENLIVLEIKTNKQTFCLLTVSQEPRTIQSHASATLLHLHAVCIKPPFFSCVGLLQQLTSTTLNHW
jgi:hypothetical protein